MLSPAPVVPARSSSASPGSSPSPPRLASFRSEGHCPSLRRLSPSLLRLASKQKPPSKRSCLLGGFFVCKLSPLPTHPLRLGEGSPPASPPELLFKAKAKNFPCLEKKFSCLGKAIFLRRKVPFLPQGGELLSEERFPSFRTKMASLPKGKYSPSAERKISFRKEIYFCVHADKFSYVRKYFFLTCENYFSYVRKFDPLQTRW